jgi:DNA ligase (NAD+)
MQPYPSFKWLEILGPWSPNQFIASLGDKRNLDFIEKLMKVGVKIVEEKKPEKQTLKGLTFVFTGGLESMTREEAKKKVREMGGEVTESVSKRVNYVVLLEKNLVQNLKKQKNLE